MAYYYVKNGGTATGDAGRYATQQTGSFATLGAANYYNSIADALAATTPPVSGDFVNVSDLHSFSTASSVSLSGVLRSPFFIVAVDDSNIVQSRTSGNRPKETITGVSDLTLSNITMSGVAFDVGDNVTFSGASQVCMIDSEMIMPSSGNTFLVITDDITWELKDSFIRLDGVNSKIWMASGALLRMQGGGITSTTGADNLFVNDALGGGFSAIISDSDLSGVTGTILSVGSSVADDFINVNMDNCKLAAGVAFTSEVFKSYNQRALFTRCSDSSAAAEYQYHLHAFGGDVDDDSTIYRNEDPAFEDSGQKISYKIVTNSDASLAFPLWLDFPNNRWAELSGASDTVRVYLTSNTALTNKDIFVTVSYPDGTNKQTPNNNTSAPQTVGGSIDLMATGTTLTTDGVSTWTGGLTNKYYIDVDTSGDVGADCVPNVKVFITRPSVTIQMSSVFELV